LKNFKIKYPLILGISKSLQELSIFSQFCHVFLYWCLQLSLLSHMQNITWKYPKWYTKSKPKWSFIYNENKHPNPTLPHHKMQIITLCTKHKKLYIIVECVKISNHQMWFEITQTRIISINKISQTPFTFELIWDKNAKTKLTWFTHN
jgi:hypothetical protein